MAQVYYRHVNSSVPQPKLALCGFRRVHLKPGETCSVALEIPAARLRYWDTEKKQYVVEPGDYEFLIGAASDDIRLRLPMHIGAGFTLPSQPVAAAPTPAQAVPGISKKAAASASTPPEVQSVIRIRAGSSEPFKDSAGNTWEAERGFEGGSTIDRDPDLAIANTKDPGLYRSEHYSMDSFSIGVPDGKYIAKLHFAETFDGISGEGQRVFTFNVQGKEFKDFDVFKKAGGANKAYIETVPVEVTDGTLKITFTSNIENPEINAIELVPQATPPK